MRQVFVCLFVLGALIPPPSARAGELAAISVDSPLPASVFPPEILAPTFLWRDPAEGAVRGWGIEIEFADHTPPIRVKAKGERMRIGEIDPNCASDTNEPPKLTPEQAAAPSETHHIAAERVDLDIAKVLHGDADLSKRGAQPDPDSPVNDHLEGVRGESIAQDPDQENNNQSQ